MMRFKTILIGGVIAGFLLLATVLPALANADGLRGEGDRLFFAGDYAGAVQKYRASAQEQSSFAAWNNLGAALIRTGDYQGAMNALQKALIIQPDNPYVYFNMGIAFYRMGNREKALWAFESVLLFRPEYQPAIENVELLKR